MLWIIIGQCSGVGWEPDDDDDNKVGGKGGLFLPLLPTRGGCEKKGAPPPCELEHLLSFGKFGPYNVLIRRRLWPIAYAGSEKLKKGVMRAPPLD